MAPLLLGLPLFEDFPLGLDLWLLEDFLWALSVLVLWVELLPPASARPSFLCCLSLRDFPDRLLSLLLEEEVEEVVLPTLAAGCTWEEEEEEDSISSAARLDSPSIWTRRLEEAMPEEEEEEAPAAAAALPFTLPEVPFSGSLLLFFFNPRSPFPGSRTLLGSLDFFLECLCPLISLVGTSGKISSSAS